MLLAGLLGTVAAHAADEAGPTPAPTAQVIEPDLARRDIKIPKIDATDVEIGYFYGTLSVEDFGANTARGWRLAYHLTEDFFVEGTYGESTVSDEAFRSLGRALFRQQQEPLTYYNLSLGINLFPGEVFVGKRWAMTSGVYVVGGVGNTEFNRTNHTTFNFGIGIRVLPWDWLSLRVEMRDHMFESDLLGKNKLTNNFELSGVLSAYF
jgi:outer membrane beta-barrel protein